MERKTYTTSGTCAREISFDYAGNKIYNIKFTGGCSGNLGAMSKLLDGQDMNKVCEMLEGNKCGPRATSCADQLVKAIKEVL